MRLTVPLSLAFGVVASCCLNGQLKPPTTSNSAGPLSLTLSYYSFETVPNNGTTPVGGLLVHQGAFLGTDSGSGGTNGSFMCYPGCGAIFSVTPPSSSSGAWSETILYAFQGGNDGADPQAGLVVGKDGTLFGTTSAGGGSTACGSFPEVEGCGTVYSLTPPTLPGGAWTEKVLYRFVGGQDGTNPQSALAVGKGGVLYGTTYYGGSGPCSLGTPLAGCGTIFSLSPPSSAGGAWSKTVLYSFQGNDGASPLGLLYGADGTLYGVANRGGNGCIAGAGANPQGCGFAFSLSPPASAGLPWTETLLHTFQSGTDGAHPNGLVFGAKSQSGFVLYGATNEGGTENSCRGYGCGTVYSLTPPTISGGAWAETILHAFPGQEGAEPEGNMAIGAGGQLYGVTSAGGEYNEGTVYVLTPPTSAAGTWTKTVLWNFQTSSANSPNSTVLLQNGTLYGTSGGGTNQGGTVYALEQ